MKEITLEKIKKYNEEFNSNKWNKIISNAITTNGINNTCFNPSVLTTNQNVFSIELPDSKRMDQKKSGRCWAFEHVKT